MAVAGRVAIVPKGDYDVSAVYKKLDLVRYNHNAYVAKKPSTGIEPTDEEYWMLMIENVGATDLTELKEKMEGILDGTLSVENSNNLGNQSPSYYATAQSVTDIIDGTTPAGNAKLLNGLTAEEFVLLNMFNGTKAVDNADNAPLGISIIGDGATNNPYAFWATLITFYNTTPSYKQQIAIPWSAMYKGQGVKIRICDSNTWTEWSSSGDGGNADTVDGLHASEFMRTKPGYGVDVFGTHDLNDWLLAGAYCSQSGDLNVPSDTDGWGDVLVFGGQTTHKTQIFRPWNTIALYWRYRYGDTWSTWVKIAKNTDLANYLPLSGGAIDSLTVNSWNVGLKGGVALLVGDESACGISSHDSINSRSAREINVRNATAAPSLENAAVLREVDSNGVITDYPLLHSANIRNYALPLDGSVPMSGAVSIVKNDGSRAFFDNLDAHAVSLGIVNVSSDITNLRELILRDSVNGASGGDITKALMIREHIDGVASWYTVLHTGNSNAIIKSTTAPSDTTAIWVDTTNNKVKAYKDGAWTVMA